MSKVPGSIPASSASTSVLNKVMPANLLSKTRLLSIVALSTPSTRIPRPEGTTDSNEPGSPKFTWLLLKTTLLTTCTFDDVFISLPGNKSTNMPQTLLDDRLKVTFTSAEFSTSNPFTLA